LCFVDNAGRVRKQVFIDCVAEEDYPSPVKGEDIILYNECTLEELVKKIKSYSTAEKINLISHYNIAEMQSFLNGRNTVVGSDLLLVQNSFLGRVQNIGVYQGVQFVDTIKFTAVGGLDKAGEAIGIPKLTIDCDKSKMLDFYYKDRKKFIEYAMRDAEICACYYYSVQSFAINQMNTKEGKLKASSIYTASNIGAIYLEERLMSNFLDAYLTGYRKVRGDNGRSKLVENHVIAKNTGYFENALVGGRNETYAYGYFPASDYMMRDYDLKGAYGTAQCVMPMWDFDKPVILDKYGRNDSDDISVIETIIETEKEEVVNKDVFLEKLKRNPLAL